jgi:hypothetical protein
MEVQMPRTNITSSPRAAKIKSRGTVHSAALLALALTTAPAWADDLAGKVLSGERTVAGSTVTLWQAGSAAPTQVASATSAADGTFTLSAPDAVPEGGSLYLTAFGGALDGKAENKAIALMAVLGSAAPASVTINEMTTIASVWTHAQFIKGAVISGPALGLKIAAGNVPNLADVTTGGWGDDIQNPLNGPQTPTMANFATLADVLAGCVSQVKPDACDKLFAATTAPDGMEAADTLQAAQQIAQNSWYKPERVFALLGEFYEIPAGGTMLDVPYMPYLNYSPSAWVLPLLFDGGGYRAGGKAMFDSEGNLWVGSNFTTGWQASDALWQGHAAKFAPDGTPLSPITVGFAGGGMEGGTFGAAVDSNDNAWLTSYGSKSITVFAKDGTPLTPPEGITFDGKLGLMQGIIVTPSGDVWALGVEKSQLVFFPGGDYKNGRIICEGDSVEPCKSFKAPFHLGIDQQDRIWVSNSGGDHLTRFPASDPTKAENFKTGINNSGLGIDSLGNVWVTNRFGSGLMGMAHMADFGIRFKTSGLTSAADYLTKTMSEQVGGTMDSGNVTLLKPDGSQFEGSPFSGGGLPGPWAIAVDGKDNIWVSNFAMPASPITQLCGARVENCPPGFKTGDAIAPPGGYVGGGLQLQTDIAVDPAGNVWAINNWQDVDSCYGNPSEALSTRCGGQGVTIFYGIAAPVKSPQIGPAQMP